MNENRLSSEPDNLQNNGATVLVQIRNYGETLITYCGLNDQRLRIDNSAIHSPAQRKPGQESTALHSNIRSCLPFWCRKARVLLVGSYLYRTACDLTNASDGSFHSPSNEHEKTRDEEMELCSSGYITLTDGKLQWYRERKPRNTNSSSTRVSSSRRKETSTIVPFVRPNACGWRNYILAIQYNAKLLQC